MIIAEWLRRIWYLVNRRRFEQSLQQEMEAHREMLGDPVRFGNTLRLREESRDVWQWNWLDNLQRDLRYGLRGLRREPTFALTAILTLALGIATTTTVFSVADSQLWKPLPFPHPEQLFAVRTHASAKGALGDTLSGADLMEWRAAVPAFSDLVGNGTTSRRILRLDTAESVLVDEVTENYFTTLGRQPIIGRLPVSSAGGPRQAVLTDRAWQRLFAGNPTAVGRTILVDAENLVITGVIPSNDSLGVDTDDLLVAFDESAPSFWDRSKPIMYGVIGRLKNDIDPAVAVAQLKAIESRLSQSVAPNRAAHTVELEDLRVYFTGWNYRPFYFFLGASLIVLLLSAVNVATLLLARAFRRTREFALRGALGGAQRTFARQLLVEGGLLATLGGGLGLLLTFWAIQFLSPQLPESFRLRGANIPIDLRVAAFVLGVSGLLTIFLLLAPLIPLRRFDLSSSLSSGGRSGRSSAEGRMRSVLLTAQIALTLILLTGAGLFLRSFVAITQMPLGFEPANLVSVRANLSGPQYAEVNNQLRFAERLVESSRAVPGVKLAAYGTSSPLGSGPLVLFNVPGAAPEADAQPLRGIMKSVSPAYFQTLGINVLRGREFSSNDAAGAPRVAIINESLAKQKFAGRNPVGETIDLLPGRAPWTNKPGPLQIVGVASSVKEVGMIEADFAVIYVPFAQMPAPWVEMVARSAVPVATITGQLRQVAAHVDPSIPVGTVRTFDERVTDALSGDRFNLLLIFGFAIVALLAAAVGIYGTMTYHVQARTRELGVRLALGARPARLVGATLWQAARLGMIGGTIGLLGAVGVAIALGDALYLVPTVHNGLIYGVTTTDPVTLAAAFLSIVCVAILSALVPARRVARVDPVLALRNE